MSLSKQQIVGIGSGCAFLLVAGLLGYMLYDAAAERAKVEVGDEETGDPGLETAKEAFMAYNRAPVFPSQGSIDAVKSNAAQYVAWYADARALAARGDYAEPAVPEDNSAFKDRLKEEVDRLAKLPGGVEGHIAGGDCRFGFEKYLGENGILPDQKDVPLLARQLASISRAVDIFAEAGVFEVQSVQRPDVKAASDDRSEKKSKGNAKGAKEGFMGYPLSEESAAAKKSMEAVFQAMLNADFGPISQTLPATWMTSLSDSAAVFAKMSNDEEWNAVRDVIEQSGRLLVSKKGLLAELVATNRLHRSDLDGARCIAANWGERLIGISRAASREAVANGKLAEILMSPSERTGATSAVLRFPMPKIDACQKTRNTVEVSVSDWRTIPPPLVKVFGKGPNLFRKTDNKMVLSAMIPAFKDHTSWKSLAASEMSREERKRSMLTAIRSFSDTLKKAMSCTDQDSLKATLEEIDFSLLL